MPKTNDQTGATYAGVEGIVEHGAPIDDGRTLSQLDPERDLDGETIPGEHPDREDLRPTDPQVIDPQPAETDYDREQREEREGRERRESQAARENDADDRNEAGRDAARTPLDVTAAKDENAKDGEDVSAGTSSGASQQKTGTTNSRVAKNR